MSQIQLSDFIKHLRSELELAQQEGENERLQFLVEDAEIELQVMASEAGKVGAGLKFWVVNVSADVNSNDTTSQKIKLKLSALGEDGLPLKISRRDRR